MKLVQFFLPGKGKRVGLVQGDRVLDITSSDEGVGCTLDLVVQGKTAQGMVARGTWLAKRLHRKALDWRELQRSPSRRAPHLLVPIDPPEVWGAKGTYAPEPGQTGIALTSGDAPAAPAEHGHEGSSAGTVLQGHGISGRGTECTDHAPV